MVYDIDFFSNFPIYYSFLRLSNRACKSASVSDKTPPAVADGIAVLLEADKEVDAGFNPAN